MVNAEVVAGYRIRNHDARNLAQHTHLGRTARGTEIWLDRGLLGADLKVVTGLIEPHLMAGFSGGRKAVAPGCAGVEMMRSLHGAAMLESPLGPGIIDGNPFHDELLDVARRVGVDFMCDVHVNRSRELTAVFAGDLERAHAAGVAFVERHVRAELGRPAEIVIASAGGFPLDDTYYQSIKGMVAALNVVRRGGTIILAAAIREGIGSAEFRRLLGETHGNDDFMARISSPGFFSIDQWMVQHLCQVRRKAEVILVSDGVAANAATGLMGVQRADGRDRAGALPGEVRPPGARRRPAAGPLRARHRARAQTLARPGLAGRRGLTALLGPLGQQVGTWVRALVNCTG
jgi:nickel-dependent lactate racemase